MSESNPLQSVMATAGKTFRTANISHRVGQITISPIKEMSILADEFRQQTGADVISFGQGVPSLDTPEHIKQAIRASLDDVSTAKYTLEPGITELRDAIARFLTESKGAASQTNRHNVMVSVGCQEAVACALATTIDPGDEVILPSPCYASHIQQILQFGGVPIYVPLNEAQGWRLDETALRNAITDRTKVILFSNPTNPTGTVWSQEELMVLATIAQEKNLIIIADETYDFLTYDGIRFTSAASVPGLEDRVIVCGSFSKKYAMTGYRVGYAFAHESLIDHLLKVHDALAICAPAISQVAALSALTDSQECVQRFYQHFDVNRRVMCEELDKLSDYVSYVKPRGAYYILVKVSAPQLPSFELALRLLREAHIIVIPGAAFGPNAEGALRFSFAGEQDQIVEGFKRLKEWFSHNTH